MSDRKNIDRLFQEKFKDFEAEPNEKIWINIDAALREKKKRRVIPIWYRLGGIAAALVLGFFAFNSMFNEPELVKENPVVIENQLKDNTILEANDQPVVDLESASEKSTLENGVSKTNSPSTNENDKVKNGFSKGEPAVVGLEKKKTGNMKKPGLSSEENNAVVGKNEALAGESKGFLKQKKAAGREKKTASLKTKSLLVKKGSSTLTQKTLLRTHYRNQKRMERYYLAGKMMRLRILKMLFPKKIRWLLLKMKNQMHWKNC